jgi:hypothetical protein
MMQLKPHKHSDLIKAWADGALIERLGRNGATWYIMLTPSWRVDGVYRIKPQPKKSKA